MEAVVQSVVINVAEHGAGLYGVVAVLVNLHGEAVDESTAILCSVALLLRNGGSLGHEEVVLVVQVLESAHRQARRHAPAAQPLVVRLDILREFQQRSNIKQPLQEIEM